MVDVDSTRKVAERDQIDQDIDSLKKQGLFESGEIILNPVQERKVQLLEKKANAAEETISTLKSRLQYAEDLLKQKLLEGDYAEEGKGKDKKKPKPLTKEQIEKALKSLADSRELNIAKRREEEAAQERDQAVQDRDEAKKELADYKQTQQEILTEYQADREIQKKVGQLHELRRKYDALASKIAGLDHAQRQFNDQTAKAKETYDEVLVPKYNTKVEQLRKLDEQIRQKRIELERLKKLQPLGEEETSPEKPVRKKVPGWVRRIIRKT